MPLYEFEGKRPTIDPTAWIAESADIIGDVLIGPRSYIGWNAVLRGDHGRIIIGAGSAVEEGVIVHISPGFDSRIGPEATIGHGAMLHNATIDAFAVIGIRATVSNFATVGEWSIIGEMGLVRERQTIPPGVIAVGQPVKIIGQIQSRHKERWLAAKKRYQELTRRNKKSLKRVQFSIFQ
ncbi:MAG: gamma carbonic anhydrase family protein [Desulfobacterales bacterium]|nr:MAG: gamma carbonic anhydrase family protein [Desulfobacterales bacterium]